MAVLLGALFYGVAGCVGILLAGTLRLERFEDGPKPSEPPIAVIMAGCALVGSVILAHNPTPSQIVVFAIVISALAAIWCTDVRFGIVPDVFTLVPLGIILLLGLVQRQPEFFVSAAVPFVPFAMAAMLSKGRGMGWGDVKLAALGGAVLGARVALLAFTLSCLVAVLYSYLRGRKGEPIAFAPFLAVAIGAAMPIGTLL